MDPLLDKTLDAYGFGNQNPVRFVDPWGMAAEEINDDITINKFGEVINVIKTNKPNRFFDLQGKEIKLNDPNGVDRELTNENYKVGDKISYHFNIISKNTLNRVVKSVSSNKEIKNILKAGGNSIKERGYAYPRIALESYSESDFTFSYLIGKVINPIHLTEDGSLFATHYVENEAYFMFEGQNVMYNLYDAGNFMWGAWAKEIGLSNTEIKIGTQLNEILKFNLGDDPADQKAVFDGFKY